MRLLSCLTWGLVITTFIQPLTADFRSYLHPAVTLPDSNDITNIPTTTTTTTSTTSLDNILSTITQEEAQRNTKYARVPEKRKNKKKKSRSPHFSFLLTAPSSSSSSNTGPVDEALNEDSDILNAVENGDTGAMSSIGVDTVPSSSSSSAPAPPKVPAMAAAIMTHAIKQHMGKHKNNNKKHVPIERHIPSTPRMTMDDTTSSHVARITPIQEEETTSSSSPIQSISLSPFLRLSVLPNRNDISPLWSHFSPAFLQPRTMSIWRRESQPISMSMTSKVMRIFPVGPHARIYIQHIHQEPAIQQQHVCKLDAQRLCQDEMHSHSMFPTMACLIRHVSEVSSSCAHEITNCPIMACAADVMEFCTPEQRLSHTAIKTCLTQQHVSERCQSATEKQQTPINTSTATTAPSSTIVSPFSMFAAVSDSSASSSTSSSSASSSFSSSAFSYPLLFSLLSVACVLLCVSIALYVHLRRISSSTDTYTYTSSSRTEPSAIRMHVIEDEAAAE